MGLATMKSKFPMMPPKVITWHMDMKKIYKDSFRVDPLRELGNINTNVYIDFETAFSRALD